MSESRLRGLPGVGGALSRGRLIAGFVLTVAGLPLLTWPLAALRVPTALTAEVLSYQLFVVVVALVGGLWPALLAAVGAGFFLDFFFEPPLYVIRIAEPAHFATLIIFVIVAVLVSIVVDQAARRLRAATRLAAEAAKIPPLAAADRLRSALLAAVGHDLRRPLSAATAAVTSLRATDVTLSATDRAELLETADESLSELAKLVTDLLDVSRLQAGVLGVTLEPVSLREIVTDATTELGLGAGAVKLELGDIPTVSADPALLQRVVVNLLANAIRFAPGGAPPVVSTGLEGATVQLRVIDTGPGVPPERREEMFLPFQRLGDTDNTAGVGLGLALARGFVEAMGGSLSAQDTPGGGLTMVVELAPDRGDGPNVDGAAT